MLSKRVVDLEETIRHCMHYHGGFRHGDTPGFCPDCRVMLTRGVWEMDETDYITVLPTMNPDKFLTVVMKYDHEEYIQTRISRPLEQAAALALAKSWAAALKLGVR